MALVVVRDKKPAEGAEPAEHIVDEAWLERWPEDFELVRYVVETDEKKAAAAVAPAKATEAPSSARSRTDGFQ